MAQDFGDEMGDALKRAIGRALDTAVREWIRERDFQKRLDAQNAARGGDASGSEQPQPEEVCLAFGDEDAAARFAGLCQEAGIEVAALADKDGGGYIRFAPDDLERVQGVAPAFAELMTKMQIDRIAKALEGEPVTAARASELTMVGEPPTVAAEGEPGAAKAAETRNRTEGIAEKVAAARDGSTDFEAFKAELAKQGIGVTVTKDGENMFYEARRDALGNLLPYSRALRDWAVGADTLRERYGVDATNDWFDGRDRAERAEGGLHPMSKRQEALIQKLAEAGEVSPEEIEALGPNPSAVSANELLNRHARYLDPEVVKSAAVPEPQAADGSLDADGRTPDLNQGIESHDGMDTDARTLRLEREQNGTDVAPSMVREEAARASEHDPSLAAASKECRAASKQLERESGVAEREIDVSDNRCECELREEREREEREAREAARAKAERVRAECFKGCDLLRDCTFERDDGHDARMSSACLRYAETFDKGDRFGLLLWGDVGTGKSFMSAAIANRVIERGFSALMTDIGTIVTMRESSFNDRQRLLERLMGCDLLLIDDLGAQRDTPYMMEQVYAVIDGRYRAAKPMVITTNMDAEQIASRRGHGPWSRVIDRILEVCYPLDFRGKSRRVPNTTDMRDEMRNRLGL